MSRGFYPGYYLTFCSSAIFNEVRPRPEPATARAAAQGAGADARCAGRRRASCGVTSARW